MDKDTAAPEGARVCRRCLLEDMADEQAAYLLLREWIDALPSERRAGEGLYRARLRACSACNHLNRGTCALCGCYVELRAAIAAASCPCVPARWTAAV